ncbi:MAG: hypothetical protein HC838_16695, partial [Spirulinaceae cyanobacterium RM2_2_10]|nr:hypothetical protein [Spirulinaceae cyanobacterium RM2_2_10]
MASTPIATRRPTAVVCTAVEGFRPRRAADAAQTLTLLERDRQLLRALAAQHDGTVLQTFESGLLLAFASAEQAVLYAIAAKLPSPRLGRKFPPAIASIIGSAFTSKMSGIAVWQPQPVIRSSS